MNHNLTGSVEKLDRPPTQVESELNELRGTNEELLRQCHRLQQRLQSVLRSEVKPEPANAKPPRTLLVPLAESINSIREMTREAVVILMDIHDSVECPLP